MGCGTIYIYKNLSEPTTSSSCTQKARVNSKKFHGVDERFIEKFKRKRINKLKMILEVPSEFEESNIF